MVQDLRQRIFGGSSKELVLRALREGRPSRDDLAEIRKVIDELSQRA